VVKKLGAVKTGAGDRPIKPPKLLRVKPVEASAH